MGGETRVGDYVIHYNALHSENLTPEIAKRVGLKRSADNIVLIVNVQQPETDTVLNAVPARVTGSARDLFGNKKPLNFRQVKEAGAIDYMAQTNVKNEQTLIFDLSVTPEGGPVKTLQFQQTFYVSSD